MFSVQRKILSLHLSVVRGIHYIKYVKSQFAFSLPPDAPVRNPGERNCFLGHEMAKMEAGALEIYEGSGKIRILKQKCATSK